MSLDQEPVPRPEVPVTLSPAFPAPISLSEQPQLTKNRPPVCSKNGLQASATIPPPPTATQRIGKRRFSMGISFRGVAKRRRRANSDSQAEPVLPSHFLLGGNIFDPLNLNSLLNEDVNRATNQETPKCSPVPSRSRDPVEILVPRDITDPLNLKGGSEEGGAAGVLLSPLKSRRKHRYKHHGGGGASTDRDKSAMRLFPPTAGTSGVTARGGSVCASPLSCELNTAITCREDLAPSPRPSRRHTHPPPGPAHKPGAHADCRHRRRRRTTSVHSDANHITVATTTCRFQTPLVEGAKAGRCGGAQRGSAQPSERRKDKHRYQHGNHSRYYGYHGFYGGGYGRVGVEEDPRLRLLDADWFRDKTVLDVGCGAGHMTLAIARKFNPSHILGVELDKHLVHAAKQNIRHFLSHDMVVERRSGEGDGGGLLPFPLSFRVSRGPICGPSLLPSASSSRFPHNVTFIQGDYIAGREEWPGRGQFDVILCLGLTKWVHLQSGDEGVVRLFRRTYQSLSPGGMFILEPQPWSSYSRSKRATDSTFRRFRSLRIRPEHFTSILTDSVGFCSYRLLTHTDNKRPVYLFHKGPSQRK
ncbi:7SK snRNA methylphosphate capping enzyme [Oryzias melastigma]|uniref:RNA methyltransferase n=1 Tax=Oryzias melastigma TaxID=30732 RepID=A0A3B3BMK7_ORYME|nr:7SK snRNA methylphosphate capping enzyme [Oryzias melastigma]XP_036072541.1 7SK snRNA methylphosphate capping enzyme [Oryzias melastigma]